MAEIGVLGARGEDQPIVWNVPAAIEPDQPCGRVDTGHLAQQRGNFLTPVHELPDGPGDLRGTERRRRHLVQERLEQMMVAAVDERDVGVDALQLLDGGQSAKAPTDDDDFWFVGHSLHQSRAPRERYATAGMLYNSTNDLRTEVELCGRNTARPQWVHFASRRPY